MKIYLTIILLSTYCISTAQGRLNFTYDPKTGSQTVREFCFGCTAPAAKPAKDIKEIEALADEDLLKFSPEDLISYYPNPVKEELYIKWQLIDENTISSIQVISITGQVLKNYSTNNSSQNINIPFQDYSNGMYLVQLQYLKGDVKTIKIIKQ